MSPLPVICPICALRNPAQMQSLLAPLRQYAVRSVTQSRRKRPTRMTLSPSVARPSTRRRDAAQRPLRREFEGPFAALNRTTAGPRLEAEQGRMKTRRDEEAGKSTDYHRTRDHVNPRESTRISDDTTGRSTWSTTDRKKKASLSSGGMKALQMQRALSHIGYAERMKVKKSIENIGSFSDFPLLPILLESIPLRALKGMVDISPTPVQRLAIPALLGVDNDSSERDSQKMKQFLLAAETGSGKTLAYLLPTVDSVKRADIEQVQAEALEEGMESEPAKRGALELESPPLSNSPHHTAGRPKAIVLVPTSELVEQIGGLFKAFSHAVKLRVSLLSAAYSATVIRNRLFSPQGTDIVVSTPHLLQSITESEPNILSRVTHLVVDEADSLFDRSFAPLTTAILDRATPSLKQLILCSATIPRSLDGFLLKRFPRIQRLATPNLHAIPRRVQLSVVEIDQEPYRGNRDLACADSIWQIGRTADDLISRARRDIDAKRVIVFVNEREKASELAEYLKTKGIDAVALTRDTVNERKAEILDAFTGAKITPVPDAETLTEDGPPSMIQNPLSNRAQRTLENVKVLVMTDIGSRGIDTIAVRNVVLYDVPHTSIDFIHRLGRIGRMGRRGRGFVLVGKRDRKDVVREVREGMFRGQALI